MLLLLSAAIASLASAIQAADVPSRIEVASGRAVLVQRGDRGSVLVAGDERSIRGSAHLFVGAGAEVRASWYGVASLRLAGPVEIDWRAADELASETAPLEWTVLRSGEINVEVRRGAPRLNLPGGWFARLGPGSYHVDGDATGRPRFEVRAGEPVLVFLGDPSGRARPPIEVATGARVRLSPELIGAPRPDETAGAAPWPRATRSGSAIEPSARTAAEPGVALQVAVASEAPRVTLELPRRDLPLDPPAASAPAAIELPVAVRGAEEPEPEPADHRAGDPGDHGGAHPGAARQWVAHQWRGLDRDGLVSIGPGAVQSAPGMRWTELGSGRWRIALSASAERPIWLLGSARDTLIWPGASITVDRSGFLQAYQGWIRVRSAPVDRPRLEELEP